MWELKQNSLRANYFYPDIIFDYRFDYRNLSKIYYKLYEISKQLRNWIYSLFGCCAYAFYKKMCWEHCLKEYSRLVISIQKKQYKHKCIYLSLTWDASKNIKDLPQWNFYKYFSTNTREHQWNGIAHRTCVRTRTKQTVFVNNWTMKIMMYCLYIYIYIHV